MNRARTAGPVRAAEVRPDVSREEVRPKKQRLRKGMAQQSPTYIPREMIPEDIDLQWVTDSIHGAPEIHTRQNYEMNAWEPVTPDMFGGRFDGMFMPKGHKGEINVYGQVLMWRPLELTMEARAEESADARNAMIAIETKLRNGQLDGVKFDTQHPSAKKVTSIQHERVSTPVAE
ncbi:MAG: hypothetical protein KGL39_06450 [Patescibacteria group bacterium]|nr:hypothetical protein [Patescibacteria group bacterium]